MYVLVLCWRTVSAFKSHIIVTIYEESLAIVFQDGLWGQVALGRRVAQQEKVVFKIYKKPVSEKNNVVFWKCTGWTTWNLVQTDTIPYRCWFNRRTTRQDKVNYSIFKPPELNTTSQHADHKSGLVFRL